MNITKSANQEQGKGNWSPKDIHRWTVIPVILLILCLYGCKSAESSEYRMIMNGDDTFEVSFNNQFIDPGVTFVDDDNTPVSNKKQAELEQEITVIGLEQLDTSTPGEYSIEYRYGDQTLKRLVKVLPGRKIKKSDNNNDSSDSTDSQKSDTAKGSDDKVPEQDTSVTPASTKKPSPATKPNNSHSNSGNTASVSDKNDSGNNKPVSKKAYILPSNVTFDSHTVTYNGTSYTIKANNVPSDINVVYVNNTGTDAGSYNATVYFTLSGTLKNKYSSVEPSSMSAKLTINKAVPGYTIPTGLTASEGQTLADVKLPKGFSFEDTLTTSVGAPGNNEFTITFTPDSVNYKAVQGIKAVIHVTKKPNPIKPKFQMPADILFKDRTETYDGTEYVIVAENIPEELRVTYSDNARINAGSQTASANFTLSDKGLESYSGIDGTTVMTAVLKINPGEPLYTVPNELTAVDGQTLADVASQLDGGFSFEDPLSTLVGEPGYKEFTVKYTPDSSNYKVVEGIKVTIFVTRKPDSPKTTFTIPDTVVFRDLTTTYNGSEHEIIAENVPDILTVSYTNNSRTNVGYQQATATFNLNSKGLENFSGINGPNTKTATLKINPAEPSYTTPVGLTAVEGQTLADVVSQLDGGFSFEDPLSTLVGEPGYNEFLVTYNPGSSNYKTVSGIRVTINVIDRTGIYILPSTVSFCNIEQTYNPNSEVCAQVNNLPENIVKVTYYNNTRKDAGEQTARAEFEIKPEYADIYDSVYPNFMEAKITIHQAVPTYSKPTGLTAKVGQTLRDIALQLSGTGFEFEAPLTESVGFAGINTFNVKYTPSDKNYKTITGIPVHISVTYDDDGCNKDELIEAIKNANEVNKELYTSESYQQFLEAYNKANKMPETNQDEIDAKTDAIHAALKSLVEKDTSAGED